MKLKFTKVKFVTVSKQLDPNAIQATQNPVKLKFTKVKFVTVSKQLDPNAIQTTQNSVKLKFTKVKLVTAKPSPKDLIFKKNEISFKYIYIYIYIYIYHAKQTQELTARTMSDRNSEQCKLHYA